ncbi:hypothetical protein TrRE_jg8259 [Triparma retinervis]|uniref:Uncharacterized protein n=1 Tax=Triparma retinervis TaxID=2557542 RepID=A0A9W7AHA1_9STRA|nr:hypothetical protein TrRE_jg8259 [Triparma retinervis]
MAHNRDEFISRPTTPLLHTKLSTFKTSLHRPKPSTIKAYRNSKANPTPENMYGREDGTHRVDWCESDDIVVGARDEKEKGRHMAPNAWKP